MTPTSANGSANTVCGSLTKFAYVENRDVPANVCPSRASRGVGGRRAHRAECRATATSHPRARLVASSIAITCGHSRANPSSGSFLVASIPIFEPYVKARLE